MSEEEFGLLLWRVDAIYDDETRRDEVAKLNALLGAYERGGSA